MSHDSQSHDIQTRDIQPRIHTKYNEYSYRIVKYLNSLLNEMFWYQNYYEWSETKGKFKYHKTISVHNTILEDIQECYWLNKTSSGKYHGLVKLQNGYGYFKAVSGYCGLVTSSLVLFKAPTREILIEYAMSNRVYTKYIKKTVPN